MAEQSRGSLPGESMEEQQRRHASPISYFVADLLLQSSPQTGPSLQILDHSNEPAAGSFLASHLVQQSAGALEPVVQPSTDDIDPSIVYNNSNVDGSQTQSMVGVGSPSPLTSSAAASPASQATASTEPEVFESAAEVPRVGGWTVPRRRSNAVTPPLDVPKGWFEEDDPDDRPIMGDATSCMLYDRSWIAVRRKELEQEEGKVKEEKELSEAAWAERMSRQDHDRKRKLSPASGPSSTPKLSGISAPRYRAKTPTDARSDIIDLLRNRYASSPLTFGANPALLEDLIVLVAQGSTPFQNGKITPAGAKSLRALSAIKNLCFVLSEAGAANTTTLLVCDPAAVSFDVVELPTAIAARLTSDRGNDDKISEIVEINIAAGQDSKKRKRGNGQGQLSSKLSSVTSSSCVELQDEVVDILKAEREALLSDRETLRRNLDEANSALSSSNRQLSDSREEVTLLRSLYEQSSSAARAAMSKSSALQDRVQKLECQLHEGLELLRNTHATARQTWQNEEKLLRGRLQLLEGQQARAEDAAPEFRKAINDWKVWKLKEQERLAKAEKEVRKRQELQDERRKELFEVEDEELIALREEALAVAGEGGSPSSTAMSFCEGRPQRRRKQAVPPGPDDIDDEIALANEASSVTEGVRLAGDSIPKNWSA